jgi:2-polyprenyl-6-methoxyphenol hydroxylase-like FAD-dependent oxidoreductase
VDIPAIMRETIEVFEYPMVDRDPLPGWHTSRITLLGDAAHPMYPAGSNGATQAIIDARALACCLATHSDIDDALAAYDEQRRPVVTEIQVSNRTMGPESVITTAHLRAPHGFANIEDVIPAAELTRISTDYAKKGGFDPETVNRPSPYSVNRSDAYQRHK